MNDRNVSAIAARLLAGESTESMAAEIGCSAEDLDAWRGRAVGELEALLDGETAAAGHSGPVLHHVGVVVRDEGQMQRFADLLGLREVRREHLPKYRVTNVFFSPGSGPQIQFMLPDGGILANYNSGRGGLHHIAFWAPDITPVQRDLEARGLRFIAAQKQQGIGNFKFNFVLPNVEGVSVELIEDPDFGWPHSR